MKRARKARIVKAKPLDRTVKRGPKVKGSVFSELDLNIGGRTIILSEGGEVKQIEYVFDGIKEAIVFRVSEVSVTDIEKIVSALGINWEPDDEDFTADYIKFIPKDIRAKQ